MEDYHRIKHKSLEFIPCLESLPIIWLILKSLKSDKAFGHVCQTACVRQLEDEGNIYYFVSRTEQRGKNLADTFIYLFIKNKKKVFPLRSRYTLCLALFFCCLSEHVLHFHKGPASVFIARSRTAERTK